MAEADDFARVDPIAQTATDQVQFSELTKLRRGYEKLVSDVTHSFRERRKEIEQLRKQVEQMAATITDLQNTITKLQTDVAALIAQEATPAAAAAIDAANTALTTLDQQVVAATTPVAPAVPTPTT